MYVPPTVRPLGSERRADTSEERWLRTMSRFFGIAVLGALVVAAGCGGKKGGHGGTGAGPDSDAGTTEECSQPSPLALSAHANALHIACATPARFASVAAGSYTIQLAASTLSKGGVYLDTATGQTVPSVDSYVIVNVPLPAGDPQEGKRFFTLNGIGATATFS